MEEDIAFNHYLRGALESGKVLTYQPPRRVCGWRKWGLPMAVAASLVVAVALQGWFELVVTKGENGTTDTVSAVIGLLCEVDKLVGETWQTKESTDLLLAWQDAPYCEALPATEPASEAKDGVN